MSSVFEKELQAVELQAVELKALEVLEVLEALQAIAVASPGQSPLQTRPSSKSSSGKQKQQKRRQRGKRHDVSRLPLLRSLRYTALLKPTALSTVKSAVDRLVAIDAVQTAAELLAMIKADRYSGILLDPSLVSASDVETIKAEIVKYPRPLIAHTPLSYEAAEMMVPLARDTGAQFVFVGSTFETRALKRALVLAPHVELGRGLCDALASQLARLGDPLSGTITRMIRFGDGPVSPDDIAAQCRLNRRTMERRFIAASLVPSRLFVTTARVVRAYSAITRSTIPLRRIAGLLGYATQRSLDGHLRTLLKCASSELREGPLTTEAAVELMAGKLTLHRHERNNSFERDVSRSLKLLPAL